MKLEAGTNVIALRAALILASVPVKVMTALPLLPVENVRPPVPDNVNAPLLAARVTCSTPPPASLSATEIALPLADENVSVLFSFMSWEPGMVLTGG